MEDGTQRPVGFASRTLSAAEIKYSQLDKEGGAIMFALKKFHKQIYGPCFVIMTDHKPLTFTRKKGIVHKTSAPYHPVSNGLAERALQTVKSGITKTAGNNVETKLQRLLFDYRRTPQTTTGKWQMEVLNQRKMRSRLDLPIQVCKGRFTRSKLR
ncbi:hypothetical protein NP493_7237g00001 [Ridgeia piscesae]|uniref:Integrase catalytic domain-containing protein n=1 Tax=Ridgeia piscesae TaxID=27915 RepID=A0AAD9MNH1_RIDPI|nr:hypothetical protein NP493_7237g00001 [Ridgeia piscesae]